MKTLSDVADLLEKEGWTKQSYHNEKGYCVLGAIYAVCGRKFAGQGSDDSLDMDGAFELQRQLTTKLQERNLERNPIVWNDSSYSVEEIIEVLRA
jgi:hypothetical protein